MKKTYFITGGAGFIGTYLTAKLLKENNKVIVVDNFSTSSRSNIVDFLDNPDYKFIFSNIENGKLIDDIADKSDVIIHLAAAVGVKLIVDNPTLVLETNIFGSEIVYKAALKYSRPILITSTSEVYGKGSRVPFSEDDDVVLGPTIHSRWAYGASKMIDEFLGLAYYNKFGLPVTIVRLFNTVGPGQSGQYGMVLPRFIQQALTNENITVFGSGTQTRCFCDVNDVVVAILGLLNNPSSAGEIFNVGGNQEISMLGLAKKVKEITKSSSNIVKIPYSKAYSEGFEDMQRRVPNVDKINKKIGWIQKNNLDEIIIDTVNYMKKKLGTDTN